MTLNKSLVLTVLSSIGTVATAIIAIKETKKNMAKIDTAKEKEKKEEPIYAKIFNTAWDYKFTILGSGATIGCGVASFAMDAKTIAGLTATCAGVIANRNAILKTVKDHTKENPDIMEDIHVEAATASWRPDVSVEDSGFGKTLCYFEYTGRWFYSSEDAILEQNFMFNEELMGYQGASASINDIYSLYNITCDQIGSIEGWSPYSYSEDEGVIFNLKRVNKWRDIYGEEHDADILIISIDESTLPERDYYMR